MSFAKRELGTKFQNRTTTVTILKCILITEAYVGILGVSLTVSSSCIPVGFGNMRIKQTEQRIKKYVNLHFQGYMVPCSERTSSLQTFWRKNMQRDKWPQNNFPVVLPKNTSFKNIFSRHSLTIFKTLCFLSSVTH